MKGPLAGLMQQAQRMQEEMKRAQEEIAQTEVTGQAGGGIVSVVMSGRHEMRRVSIDRAAIGRRSRDDGRSRRSGGQRCGEQGSRR